MKNSSPLPSFEDVYREHAAAVRRRVARYVAAPEVEDLTQEVFARVARQLEGFEARSSLRTWLHRIAVNAALDHVRSRGHRERQWTVSFDVAGDETGREPGEAPETLLRPPAPDQVIRAEMCQCIREHVGKLPEEYREILRLKDDEHLTSREISERLGIGLDAAKIRLHRARRALRTQLDHACEYYRTADNTLACDRKAPAADD